MEARDHALHIAVENGTCPVEGDRGDGCGGVVADARQRFQPLFAIGKTAAMIAGDRFRTFLQVPRAGVVAEAGPGLHHILGVCRGKVADRRPQGEEFLEVSLDRLDRRLLKHHLRQPDAIGVGNRTFPRRCRRHPPWKVAVVTIVPFEKKCGARRLWKIAHHLPGGPFAAYTWPMPA